MLTNDLNICLGVELRWLSDITFSCRFCLLSRQKNSLTITDKKVTEGSLSAVLETLPKNFPVALCLGGKGTLHKILNSEETLNEEQVFRNAFTGVDSNDFYFQLNTEGNSSFVSVIRKNQADPLLGAMERSGLKIYNLTVGPAITTHIWSQLNIYGDRINFDGHCFSLTTDKKLVNYTYDSDLKNEFPIKIGEEVIAEEYLVAYAAAFQLLLHKRLVAINVNANVINKSFKLFLEQRKLKLQGMIIIFGFFFLLMISFLMFSYYNTRNAALARQVGSYTAYMDNTELLKQNITENEYLIRRLVWNNGYNYGYLMNELGSSTPNRLVLKNIVINEFRTEEEKIKMQPNIRIIGITDNLSAVNNWIFILKEKPWVIAVKLLYYQQDTENNQYQFSLLLTY